MPFLIRYSTDVTPGSTYDVLELSPGPTEVDYPDFRLYNARKVQDGQVIIQRPLHDDRLRKWIWKGYKNVVPNYESQFDVLLSLEARQRALDVKNPIIQIWEDESDEGGFGVLTSGTTPDMVAYSNISWVEVKFLQVHRKSRGGGGLVTYDDTWIDFVITDPTWEQF